MKWFTRDMTTGELNAVVKNLGSEVAFKVASGQLVLSEEQEGGLYTLKPAQIVLFDKNGRRIPLPTLQYSHCDPDRSFGLKQPKLDYLTRLVRAAEAFNLTPDIQAVDFESQASALIAELQASEFLHPLLKGVYYPLYIPKLAIEDYGDAIENVLVAAVERAYQKEFPGRQFTNYHKGTLTGELTIIPGMRHERIVERAKQGSQVVIYFPNPLQGFSVLAQREQMATLPERLSLAGPLETLTAAATYTDTMLPKFHTPGYDQSAVQWRQPGQSLDLRANVDEAKFGCRGNLGGAYDWYSGGLVFSR